MKATRRPFLLLEVLIAMALIALVAIPLLAPGIWMVKNERAFNEQIEADRQAGIIFAKIVEDLFQGREEVIGERQIDSFYRYSFGAPLDKENDEETLRYILYPVTIVYTPKHGKPLSFFYEIFVEVKSDSKAPHHTD